MDNRKSRFVGLLSTHAFTEENATTNDQQPTEEPTASPQAEAMWQP
jgi:hypothetical protein